MGRPLAGGSQRIVLGVVLYQNSTVQIDRLVRSVELNQQLLTSVDLDLAWLDNSPDGACNWVADLVPAGATYQQAGWNIGFAAGHNRLMKVAFESDDTSAYVCVNPDAVLHPRCLMEMKRESERAPAPGLIDARLFPEEHPKPYHPITHDTPWCSGCVLWISRELFRQAGGFDEEFFMYCEDVDLSWRARALGFPVRTAPAGLVHHHAEGRPILRDRELAVRRSAAYLGYKYGSKVFAEKYLGEYLALGGRPVLFPSASLASAAEAKFANFDHLLQFCQPRW